MQPITIAFTLLLAVPVAAHPPGSEGQHDHDAESPLVAQSPPRRGRPSMEAITLPDPAVSISVRGAYRYIASNGIPDHEPGAFPNPGNPNAVRPQQHAFRVPAAAGRTR